MRMPSGMHFLTLQALQAQAAHLSTAESELEDLRRMEAAMDAAMLRDALAARERDLVSARAELAVLRASEAAASGAPGSGMPLASSRPGVGLSDDSAQPAAPRRTAGMDGQESGLGERASAVEAALATQLAEAELALTVAREKLAASESRCVQLEQRLAGPAARERQALRAGSALPGTAAPFEAAAVGAGSAGGAVVEEVVEVSAQELRRLRVDAQLALAASERLNAQLTEACASEAAARAGEEAARADLAAAHELHQREVCRWPA
jgi:hypothetical protein